MYVKKSNFYERISNRIILATSAIFAHNSKITKFFYINFRQLLVNCVIFYERILIANFCGDLHTFCFQTDSVVSNDKQKSHAQKAG